MPGRTIRLYLVDGAPSGLMTAEVMNWTGKAIVAPRLQLAKLGAREEVRRTGVYLLVGQDPQAPAKSMVYIGESDNVYARLVQHDGDSDKEFASRVVVLISKDANLTKAHTRYLEYRFIQLAKAAGRARVANGQAGSPVALPESDLADMEGFLEQVQLVLPVLGVDVTQPKVDAAALVQGEGPTSPSPTFVLSEVGATARAREVDGEFVLLRGSTARKQGVASWTSYHSLRDQLVAEGKFADAPEAPGFYVAVEDIPFSSPSAAAAAVAAKNTNGRLAWKVEDTGETYAEWSAKQLPAAPAEEGSDRGALVSG